MTTKHTQGKQWKAEADRLRLRADADAKAKAAWEGLYNERNRLWREEADRVGAVKLLLEANGCDCECEHHYSEHDDDCDRCLACRISWAIDAPCKDPLVAAAPDLLAVCERFLAAQRMAETDGRAGFGLYAKAIEAAEAAVKKARGEP